MEIRYRKYGIISDIDSTYDQIFEILDRYGTGFVSEDEYKIDDVYVIEVNNVPQEAHEEILRLTKVREYKE